MLFDPEFFVLVRSQIDHVDCFARTIVIAEGQVVLEEAVVQLGLDCEGDAGVEHRLVEHCVLLFWHDINSVVLEILKKAIKCTFPNNTGE